MYIIIFTILFFIIGFITYIVVKKIKLSNIKIKIDESYEEIKKILKRKITLYTKISKQYFDILDKEILKEANKIKKMDLSTLELDDKIINLNDEYKDFIKNEPTFIENDKIKKIHQEILEKELMLNALKEYYNSNVNIYNQLIKRKPECFFYKLLKLTDKPTMKIIKDAKLEILKD